MPGNPICRCEPGLIPKPDTITGCGPECTRDPDCQQGNVCQSQRCVPRPDPCQPSPCGPNTECMENRQVSADQCFYVSCEPDLHCRVTPCVAASPASSRCPIQSPGAGGSVRWTGTAAPGTFVTTTGDIQHDIMTHVPVTRDTLGAPPSLILVTRAPAAPTPSAAPTGRVTRCAPVCPGSSPSLTQSPAAPGSRPGRRPPTPASRAPAAPTLSAQSTGGN